MKQRDTRAEYYRTCTCAQLQHSKMKVFTVQEKSLGPHSFVNFATQMGTQESKDRQEHSGVGLGIVLGSLANINTAQTAEMQKSTSGQQNSEENTGITIACTCTVLYTGL